MKRGGYIRTEEFKKKQSHLRKGKWPGGEPYWRGKHLSAKHKRKLSKSTKGIPKPYQSIKYLGKNNPNFKGEAASIAGKHGWVRSIKGAAFNYLCMDCGKKAIDWSNKNHKYRRVLADYKPRCRLCHRRYDIANNLIKI